MGVLSRASEEVLFKVNKRVSVELTARDRSSYRSGKLGKHCHKIRRYCVNVNSPQIFSDFQTVNGHAARKWSQVRATGFLIEANNLGNTLIHSADSATRYVDTASMSTVHKSSVTSKLLTAMRHSRSTSGSIKWSQVRATGFLLEANNLGNTLIHSADSATRYVDTASMATVHKSSVTSKLSTSGSIKWSQVRATGFLLEANNLGNTLIHSADSATRYVNTASMATVHKSSVTSKLLTAMWHSRSTSGSIKWSQVRATGFLLEANNLGNTLIHSADSATRYVNTASMATVHKSSVTSKLLTAMRHSRSTSGSIKWSQVRATGFLIEANNLGNTLIHSADSATRYVNTASMATVHKSSVKSTWLVVVELRLVSDAVSDLTPGIWSHVSQKRSKESRRRRAQSETFTFSKTPINSFKHWRTCNYKVASAAVRRVDTVWNTRRIKQLRAWLLLGWMIAKPSCPCKQPTSPPLVVVRKRMGHLNLGNLMDVQERHITNRCRNSGVYLLRVMTVGVCEVRPLRLKDIRICHTLFAFTGYAGSELAFRGDIT
ncbi:hypothetical protein J6590_032002 [Homalodisca vitripennis]|nr:hypothetical protein J6590_032002 [Homalodisca vitripennis]